MAAVREDDELVVTKLDRLARSVPDLRGILDGLHARGVRVRRHTQLNALREILYLAYSPVWQRWGAATRACVRR